MHTTKPLGIIDTLSLGFSLVNRHLWLLAIPVLLELLVSYGPKVTAGPVVQQGLSLYRESLGSIPEELRNSSGASSIQDMQVMVEEAVQPISSFNILSLLLWQIPSLASGSLAYFGSSIGFEIADFSTLVLVIMSVLVFGLLATSLYLTAVAMLVLSTVEGLILSPGATRRGETIVGGTVINALTSLRGGSAEPLANGTGPGDTRDGGFSPVEFYKRLQRNWLRLMAFYGLMAVTLFIVGIVGTTIIGALTLFNQGLGSLLVGLVFAMSLLVMLYLFFSDEAIVIGGSGPIAAAVSSMSIVYRNYWASFMLVVLTTVVLIGTHLIWMSLSSNVFGALMGMVGNAYVSTGITAAVMLFYKDRVLFFQKEAAPG